MTETRRSASPITALGRELPEVASSAFDAGKVARTLLHTIRSGALATNDPLSGHPLATLVNVAIDVDGAPVLLLSGLSLHTRNLAADERASLLLAETGKGDPLAYPRLTMVGAFAVTEEPRCRRRFLARHPKAELYAGLPDFRAFRMTVTAVHLNGGFGRAAGLAPSDILHDVRGAQALIDREEAVLARLNGIDSAVLSGLTREPAGACRAVALDTDGLDVSKGDHLIRIILPHRATTEESFFAALATLKEPSHLEKY